MKNKVFYLFVLLISLSCKTRRKKISLPEGSLVGRPFIKFLLQENSFDLGLDLKIKNIENGFFEVQIVKTTAHHEYEDYIEYYYKTFSSKQGKESLFSTGFTSNLIQKNLEMHSVLYIDVKPCLSAQFVKTVPDKDRFVEYHHSKHLFYCDKKWLSERRGKEYKVEKKQLHIASESTKSCLILEKKMLKNKEQLFETSFNICHRMKQNPSKHSLDELSKSLPCTKFSEFLYKKFKLSHFLKAKQLANEKSRENKPSDNTMKQGCFVSLAQYNQKDTKQPPFKYNYSCLYDGYHDQWLEAALYITMIGTGMLTTSIIAGILLASSQGVKALSKRFRKSKTIISESSEQTFLLKKNSSVKRNIKISDAEQFKKRGKIIAKFGGLGILLGAAGALSVAAKFSLVENKDLKRSFDLLKIKFILLHQKKASLDQQHELSCQ